VLIPTDLSGLSDLKGKKGNDFAALKKKYGGFYYPQAAVEFGGEPLKDKKGRVAINEISVELTSGYEASVASLRLYGVYSPQSGKFEYDSLKKQVLLGNTLTVKFGYLETLETVFTGFVAGVNFVYSEGEMPYVEVTGMDIKGIMMAGRYAEQLVATSYGEAVREILRKTAYERLQTSGAVTMIAVSDTPDKLSGGGGSGKASAYTVEMSSESDYEFVVKAAKKFNYEFFTDRGTVYFRRAKSNAAVLLTIGIAEGLLDFDVGYSITGVAETVEAVAVDAGTGKIISARKKFTNNLSLGSYAKKLISKSRRVYIDPTIISKEHADARAASLMETMSYRLGALNCTCVGLPELQPGRFIQLSGLGSPVDNKFYLTSAVHAINSETGYRVQLTGCADAVEK
jgi:hypothetical protein